MLHSNENAKELTWREHKVLESTDDNQAEKTTQILWRQEVRGLGQREQADFEGGGRNLDLARVRGLPECQFNHSNENTQPQEPDDNRQ